VVDIKALNKRIKEAAKEEGGTLITATIDEATMLVASNTFVVVAGKGLLKDAFNGGTVDTTRLYDKTGAMQSGYRMAEPKAAEAISNALRMWQQQSDMFELIHTDLTRTPIIVEHYGTPLRLYARRVPGTSQYQFVYVNEVLSSLFDGTCEFAGVVDPGDVLSPSAPVLALERTSQKGEPGTPIGLMLPYAFASGEGDQYLKRWSPVEVPPMGEED
jgi:hypothetical protein